MLRFSAAIIFPPPCVCLSSLCLLPLACEHRLPNSSSIEIAVRTVVGNAALLLNLVNYQYGYPDERRDQDHESQDIAPVSV